jgi:hypothetical protein
MAADYERGCPVEVWGAISRGSSATLLDGVAPMPCLASARRGMGNGDHADDAETAGSGFALRRSLTGFQGVGVVEIRPNISTTVTPLIRVIRRPIAVLPARRTKLGALLESRTRLPRGLSHTGHVVPNPRPPPPPAAAAAARSTRSGGILAGSSDLAVERDGRRRQTERLHKPRIALDRIEHRLIPETQYFVSPRVNRESTANAHSLLVRLRSTADA